MRPMRYSPIVLPEGIAYEEKRRIQTIAGHHRATTAHAHYLAEAEAQRESVRAQTSHEAIARPGEHGGFQHWVVLVALVAAMVNDYFLAGSALEFAAGTAWKGVVGFQAIARFCMTLVIVAVELGAGVTRMRAEDDLASGLSVRRQAVWMANALALFLTLGIPALTLAAHARALSHHDTLTRLTLLGGLALLALACHWQVIYGARSILEALAHWGELRKARRTEKRDKRLVRRIQEERTAMTVAFQSLRCGLEHNRLPAPLPPFDQITERKLREVFGAEETWRRTAERDNLVVR